ncbi:hypothetical protein Ae168Ps1_6195 [Pseudonocardia sp. Ae168_Ps1]|nr:hypothetical protein Ae168Ps1_6195 [Pseudonocardia sp. Ae168_Ps1]OLL71567.1 hypothetical protein Ae263Ps1_6055 [Pseudonocardia sp. Ae263_Ps1]
MLALTTTTANAAKRSITGEPATAYCVSGTNCRYLAEARFGNSQQFYMYCYFDGYDPVCQVHADPNFGRWVVPSHNVANQH